jgi:8-oxo-dGTP diphosphatase
MPYVFCPQCATRLVPRRIDERNLLVCPACGWVFYNNSAPCVGVMVVREHAKGGQEMAAGVGTPVLQDWEVLLVRRAVEPFKGHWDVPGGFLESGEHPADGARREVREETGLEIEPTEVLGFFMDVYGPEQEPTLNICFLAKIRSGEEQAGSDAAEMRWFRRDHWPEKIAFSWEREALAMLAARAGRGARRLRPASCVAPRRRLPRGT